MAASLYPEFGDKFPTETSAVNRRIVLDELRYLCNLVLSSGQVEVLIVTLGQLGVAIARRELHNMSTDCARIVSSNGNTHVRLYPAPKVENLINTSGAGDCFVAGFVMANLRQLDEPKSVAVASMAASLALNSASPIPSILFDASHQTWTDDSLFEDI